MIGHHSLIEARMAGYSGTEAWVVCVEEQGRYGQFTHPEAQLCFLPGVGWSGFPTIHVFDHEAAATLDLRAVYGLIVHIGSLTRERGLRVLERTATFSPEKAIAAGAWGMIGWKPELGFKEWMA